MRGMRLPHVTAARRSPSSSVSIINRHVSVLLRASSSLSIYLASNVNEWPTAADELRDSTLVRGPISALSADIPIPIPGE